MRTPKHTRLYGLIVLIATAAALGVMHVRSTAQDKPEPPQQKPLTAEQQEKLKERDRLGAEVAKLRKEDKLAEAIAACEKMLAIEREMFGDLHDDVVGSLNQLAEMHEEREDWPAAKKQRDEVLRIQTKRYGEKDWRVSDARRALADGERLARLSAEDRRELTGAIQVYHEAERLQDQGKYREAKALYRNALAIWKKVVGPEHPDTATCLVSLGSVFQSQGDYAGARPYLEQSLAIYEIALGPEHPHTANNLAWLGYLLKQQGDFAVARPYYDRALAVRKKVFGQEHPATAQSLDNFGTLLDAQGDYCGARSYYDQALAIRKKVVGPEHPDTAVSLNNLGQSLQEQGDYAGARPYLEHALDIFKKAQGPEHPQTATSLNNLGQSLREQGDYAGAQRYYEQALAIRKKVLGAEHPDTANSLNNVGFLLQAQGDHAGAQSYYEQALAIRKKVLGAEHPDTANSLNNVGFLLHAQGEYASARPYYEQALAIRKKVLGAEHLDTAQSLNNLGVLLAVPGDYAGARPYCEQAMAIAQKKIDVAAGGLSERQQLAMADDLRYLLDSYLSVATGANVAAKEAYAPLLQTKGAALARQQRLRRARQRPELQETWEKFQSVSSRLAKLSFDTPDPKRRDIWRRQLDDATREKEELEIKLMRESAAFRRQKELQRLTPQQLQKALPAGTALVDFLEYRHSTPPPEGKGKMKVERHLVAFVVQPDQPLVRVELGSAAPVTAAIEKWRKTFGRDNNALGAGLLTPPSNRPQVSDGLRETFGPSAGHGQETVPQRTGTVPRRTGTVPQREITPAAELRRLLWEPLETHLKDAKVVLISPDGVLSRFPFAALPGKEPGSYLIEERAIAVVPVPQLLPELLAPAENAPVKPSAPLMLLVGDVDYEGDPGTPQALAEARHGATRAGPFKAWERLGGTRTEIATIRDSFEQRFAGGKITTLRQDKATEAALREHGPLHPYLHLATHGFFAPKEIKSALAPAPDEKFQPGDLFQHQSVTGWHPGLLSGLVLAGANQPGDPQRDDGILTALEVAVLDLSKVDLAVLSACETGLGEVAGGEGVLGLQRAFQVAGAKSVIATLWQVRDDAARSLMIDFYDNLWRKKMPKAEALRQAQLTMLREGVKRGLGSDEQPADKDKRLPPYYWAGFVLSGDWR